ncbi:glycine zipper domain-containing protein [Caldimonas tepidiphila]|uniref:glycine zipper domain-containing protein n=1 Tax=Caldimonas tepidiphila TaxID=2315841 RepID=UPI000E5BB1B9|nr:glycine zipper domain-containing protein [Caldimonas tepidiphila]
MKKVRWTALGATAVLSVALAGCAGMSHRDRSTATGAAIGGAAGAVLGGSTTSTIGGAAVGGIIGNQVGKDRDRKR